MTFNVTLFKRGGIYYRASVGHDDPFDSMFLGGGISYLLFDRECETEECAEGAVFILTDALGIPRDQVGISYETLG